jgi:flagellar basal-body rod modification protein FlgD
VIQIQPYATPSSMLDPAKKNAGGKAATVADTNTASNATGTSDSSIGSTFLNLLVQELQNQDPTDPMDSTAMVGQMISLNQLDQLVSINQAVGGAGSTSAAKTAFTGGTGALKETQLANPAAAVMVTSIPLDPNAAAAQKVS